MSFYDEGDFDNPQKEDTLLELMLLVDSNTPSAPEVAEKLSELARSVFVGGIEARENALSRDAYAIVCRAWLYYCDSEMAEESESDECQNAVLEALFALTLGNPQTIDDNGWEIITYCIEDSLPEETHVLAFKLLRNVFIKSEENRENFTNNMPLFEKFVGVILKPLTGSIICEWCSATKALLLCDDPSVPYNRAAERKQAIFKANILPRVADFISQREFRNESDALNASVLFLASMAVSEETCLNMELGSILQGIRAIFRNHFENKPLVRNTLALLRLLCVHKHYRDKSAGLALMKWTVDTLDEYSVKGATSNEFNELGESVSVVEEALSCCASMTSKHSCQVAQFIAKNGLMLVIKLMKTYSEEAGIMKAICILLRNVIENGGDNAMKEVAYEASLADVISNYPGLEKLYVSPILQELTKTTGQQEVTTESNVPL